ncbi:MAG: type III-A CRISPR-associated protein Csm2 [Promethearchaeota archaeon]
MEYYYFASDKKLIEKAKQSAERLGSVKTHQLRRIYSEIYSIYKQSKQDLSSAKSRLVLLMPQLAYAESRALGLRYLTSDLIEMINRVNQEGSTEDKIKEIYQFVQSVIGYHKERRK